MPATSNQPAWKRERKQPLQGPKLPTTQGPRGPIRKIVAVTMNAALALTFAATMALNVPTAMAADQSTEFTQDSYCDMSDGPEMATIGALSYVREVFDDVIVKYTRYKADKDYATRYKHLESIEYDNDFICMVPRSQQAMLRFTTENLVILITDIFNLD